MKDGQNLTVNRVRCRKGHECEWCGGYIGKGNLAYSRSFVWDNRMRRGWMHEDCFEAFDYSCHEFGEIEWSPGDFARGEVADHARV